MTNRFLQRINGSGLALYAQHRYTLLLRDQREATAMSAQHRGATESVTVPWSGLPFKTQITSDDVT